MVPGRTNIGPLVHKIAPPLVHLRDGKVVDVELAAQQHACTRPIAQPATLKMPAQAIPGE